MEAMAGACGSALISPDEDGVYRPAPITVPPRCRPWNHQWEIADKIMTTGWFGSSICQVIRRCARCGKMSLYG